MMPNLGNSSPTVSVDNSTSGGWEFNVGAAMGAAILFHHPHHQRAEKVTIRAENVFLLPGTSFGQ